MTPQLSAKTEMANAIGAPSPQLGGFTGMIWRLLIEIHREQRS
jgi:hypothetical protein